MSRGRKYTKLEFSSLEDVFLLKKVKENPPLYAKNLKCYSKNTKMKQIIWNSISREMKLKHFNRTADECKKRWANLRDYYMRKKRMQFTEGATCSRRHEQLDQFNFFDNTEFEHRTSDVEQTVNGKDSRAGNENDDTTASSTERVNDEIDFNTDGGNEVTVEKQEVSESGILYPEVIIINDEEEIEQTFTNVKRQIASESDEEQYVKRARIQELDDIRQERSEMSLLCHTAENANTVLSECPENHVSLFFKSLEATAKTLSPWYLIEAKRRLFQVMSEIEEKNMQDIYQGQYAPTTQEWCTETSSHTLSQQTHTYE